MKHPVRITQSLSAALTVALVLSSSIAAQQVSLAKITDTTTTPVKSFGDRPALDDGTVAFLGRDAATQATAIYTAPASGLGPFTVVVDEFTPIPNAPGEFFTDLDNPEIYNGTVAFTGGHQSVINDGIYMGSGGEISVWYDAFASLGINPFDLAMEAEGLSVRSVGADPSQFMQNNGAWHMPAAESFTFLTGSTPDGGTLGSLTGVGELPAMGGGHLAISTNVNHDAVVDSGVYTWSIGTQVLDLVANWDTGMPGTEFTFSSFGNVDTDGSRVAFTGQSGLLGFGGHQGLYIANVGAGGAGEFTTIAEVGDQAPRSTATFAQFGSVAVEGDLVVFVAWLGSSFAPTGMGLYGWKGGEVFRIVDSTSVLEGQPMMFFDMNFRGLDGNQVVFRATHDGPWAVDFSLYVATIEAGPWLDLGSGLAGTLGTPSLSGAGTLAGGDPITIALDGAAPDAPAFLAAGFDTVNVPFKGGVLVPAFQPPSGFMLGLATDPTGAFSLGGSWPMGLSPGLVFTSQAWVVDGGAVSGMSASNAVAGTLP